MELLIPLAIFVLLLVVFLVVLRRVGLLVAESRESEAFRQEVGDLAARVDATLADMADSKRTVPLSTGCGSIFGQLRNWMGLMGVSYIQYDDPKLFAEMIGTIGSCIVGTLERVLARAKKAGVTFDLVISGSTF